MENAALLGEFTYFMTSEELADFLRVHKNAPAEWRAQRRTDQPPFVRIGSLIRYPRGLVLLWLESRQQTGAAA